MDSQLRACLAVVLGLNLCAAPAVRCAPRVPALDSEASFSAAARRAPSERVWFAAYAAAPDAHADASSYAALAGGSLRTYPADRSDRRARVLDALPPPAPLDVPGRVVVEQGGPLAIADRWRLVEGLGVRENPLNPYAQNTLKGDRPIYGREWFLDLSLESHSAFETGRIPAGGSVAGDGERALRASRESFARQGVITSLALIRGDTVFRPPDWKFVVAGELAYARASSVLRSGAQGVGAGRSRETFLRELYVEKHLRTKSERYDFDSLRVGVQPFNADYRGFLYRDQQPGVRLYGNFAGNRVQYNLAWFHRGTRDRELEAGARERAELWLANLYYQDLPVSGFQLQAALAHDRGSAGSSRHAVTYLGLSGDGHLDRLNLTFALYGARGAERVRSGEERQAVRAYFGALEGSLDFDWYRLKAYALYASGDGDPDDGRAEGFTAIRSDLRFGGLEEGFFFREGVAAAGSERALASRRGGLLAAARSDGDGEGARFAHPGARVLGVGGDFDVLPELRLRLHAASLDFAAAGTASRHVGEECSLAALYRPLYTQNIELHASLAVLRPGAGLVDRGLVDRERPLYSTRFELVLRY